MKPVTSWEKVPVVFDLTYAACLLGMNRNSLKVLCIQKRFPAFKVGKLWRVRKDDLLAWIDEQSKM